MSDPEFSLAGAEALVRSAQANYEAAKRWSELSAEQSSELKQCREDLALAEHNLMRARTVIATTGAARDAAQERVVELEAEVAALQAIIDAGSGGGGTGPPGACRPGEDLDWGVKPRPSADAVDWIASDGALRSTRGLGDVTGWGDAYRLSRAAGVSPVVFGIMGRSHGSPAVGGHYGQGGSDELAFPGDADASATFVGLDDTASVRVGFGSHFENVQPTGDVCFFDLGVRGAPDSHLLKAKGGARHVQFDGCWLVHHDLSHEYGVDTGYMHGIALGNWDTLVVRNHKWRGEAPGSPGMKIRYYPFYLKGGRSSTLIENNDLFGGVRGCFQKRPDNEFDPVPTDRMMVRNNVTANQGVGPWGSDGGACITLWATSGGSYVYDNEFVNFRYQALVVSGQEPNRNFGHLESGNQHDEVHISGNRFLPGPDTERSTMSLSSIDDLHIYADNEFDGKIILNAQWNLDRNGTENLRTHIHSAVNPGWDLWTHDPERPSQGRRLTDAEVTAMLVTP